MPTPLNNTQHSVVVTQFMMTSGLFPSASSGNGAFTMGMVRWFAGNFDPAKDQGARGQLIQIDGNEALFNILGTTYGGDGSTTFGLPDFGGRLTVGAGTGAGLPSRGLGELFGSTELFLTQSNLPASAGGQGVALDNSQDSTATGYYIRVEGNFGGGRRIRGAHSGDCPIRRQFRARRLPRL